MPFQPSASLKSTTFLGLIFAQITAAFNDQAIHIVALLYASDILIRHLGVAWADEKLIIMVVTGCFIAPFVLFSPLAGQLADKYSKRTILVGWKFAEVGMMAFGMLGLALPYLKVLDGIPESLRFTLSAAMVVATVFLMGTHSAVFVPAKYGVMPEILTPGELSRGNGVLEATSFVAQIVGTCVGAWLYIKFKLPASGGGGPHYLSHEWMIGLILLLLSVLGALASLLVGKMPAAAPERTVTLNWWKPMRENLAILRDSRPLLVAILGIAFLAFMTLYVRQSLLYEGEMKKNLGVVRMHQRQALAEAAKKAAVVAAEENEEEVDQAAGAALAAGLAAGASEQELAELRLAILIAQVALGVGIGSVVAGYLSGHKLELGLVPLGGACLVVLLLCMSVALYLQSGPGMIICLILVGASAGLYIVPLYTLMQVRAPKNSKGQMVATSNVVNMAGGMLALAAFYALTRILERAVGATVSFQAYIQAQSELSDRYLGQLQTQILLPSILFVVAAAMTAVMFIVLGRLLPDLVLRGALWLRSLGGPILRVEGLVNLPTSGPVVVASHIATLTDSLPLLAAADRTLCIVSCTAASDHAGWKIVEKWGHRTTWIRLSHEDAESDAGVFEEVRRLLDRRHAVALPVGVPEARARIEALWREIDGSLKGAPVVPVRFKLDESGRRRKMWVVFGSPLEPGSSLGEIAAALEAFQREP